MALPRRPTLLRDEGTQTRRVHYQHQHLTQHFHAGLAAVAEKCRDGAALPPSILRTTWAFSSTSVPRTGHSAPVVARLSHRTLKEDGVKLAQTMTVKSAAHSSVPA